jgi:pyrroline-5-carboxylate reductase
MKTTTLGFIGGGRITKIFLQAFANEEMDFENVIVFDTNETILHSLKRSFDFVELGTLEQAASQAVVFIALHPPVIMEMLEKIGGFVSKDATIVSLAPKITIEKIASKLNTQKVARLIPNATSFINEGFNPIAFYPDMEKNDQKKIKKLLKILGKTFITDETKLEGYAITSAMLPTYFWFQIQKLEAIACKTGHTPEEATKAVKATMKRAIDLYFESGLTPEEVMDLIPVKPIGESQAQIEEIYESKLLGLFEKIKP